jgi:hypothetical protein
MSDLPAELTARPLALIGLFGLDISNSIHYSIWDAFNNNRRPDSAAVQFKLISSTHEFPTVKPKVCIDDFILHFDLIENISIK